MIAKVTRKFLRQAFIASKTKIFSHQIKGESVKSIIWWPLVMFVGYKKLRWEMKSESEKCSTCTTSRKRESANLSGLKFQQRISSAYLCFDSEIHP